MQRKPTDKTKTPEKKRSSRSSSLIDQQAQKVRNQDSAVRNERAEKEQSKKETSTPTSSPTMKGFNKGKTTGEATFRFGDARSSSTLQKGKKSLNTITEEEETTSKPTFGGGGKT